MVREKHGLAALEVRVAGQYDILVSGGGFEQGVLEAGNEKGKVVDGVAAVEAGVGGDLVVARAGGVEFRSGRTDALGQLGLDVHVDVLEFLFPLEGAGVDVRLDGKQAVLDGGEFLVREQPGARLGAGVGDGAADILAVEPPVEAHGFTVALDERRGFFLESAFPHGVQVMGWG